MTAEQKLKELENFGASLRQETNLDLANEFAEPGTVKHFALRLGFMPHNEKDAELILVRVLMDVKII